MPPKLNLSQIYGSIQYFLSYMQVKTKPNKLICWCNEVCQKRTSEILNEYSTTVFIIERFSLFKKRKFCINFDC